MKIPVLPFNRIILVMSDLHLSSGALMENGKVNPFENFFRDDEFIECIEFYCTGMYKRQHVELVLNGDFFEFVDTYIDGADPLRPYAEDEIHKLELIFKGHPHLFEALKKFASMKNRTISFITGNHDQGLMFPEIQERIRKKIGKNIIFRGFDYRVGPVLIQHGNQLEGVFGRIDEPYFLKDASGRDYLNYSEGTRFHMTIVRRAKIMYPLLQQIRPYRKLLRWLWLFNRVMFIRLIGLLSMSIIRDLADIRNIRRTIAKIQRLSDHLFGPGVDELLLSNPEVFESARYHVCGHSHYYRSFTTKTNRTYINTGTWVPLTNLNLGSFGRINRLSYCFIEIQHNKLTTFTLKEWLGHHAPDAEIF